MATGLDVLRVMQAQRPAQPVQQAAAYQPQVQMPQSFMNAFDDVGGALAAIAGGSRVSAPTPQEEEGLQGLQMERMDAPRSFVAGASDLGERVSNIIQYDPNRVFTDFGEFGKFGLSLPFSMIGGILQAPAGGYEALTGKVARDNPFTPEKEVDLETGMADARDLTGPQRFASGVDALINSVGLGVGGSARLIGSGISAISRGAKAGGMATGIFGRAMKTPVARVGGQLAFDAAEEGGEEFVQSYLEDVRYDNVNEDSFGKALQAASLGAAGGGIMSGAGMGIRKLAGRRINSNVASPDDNIDGGAADPADGRRDVAAEYRRLFDARGTTPGMTNIDAMIRESQMNDESRKMRGSVVVKHARTNYRSRNLDEATISDDSVVAAYRNGNQESRENMANAFHATVEEMDAAIGNREFEGQRMPSVASALNALIQRGGNVSVVIFRNPDTRNGGYMLDITGVTHGGDLQTHPAVYSIFGGDIDGDTSIVSFIPGEANVLGYASEMLVHPEGRKNVAHEYLGIDPTIEPDAFKARMLEHARRVGANLDQATVNEISDSYFKARDAKNGDGDGSGIAAALNSYRAAVSKAAEDAGLEDHRGLARRSMNGFLHSVSDNRYQAFTRRMMPFDAYSGIEEELKFNSAGTQITDSDINQFNEQTKRFLEKHGTMGDNTAPAAVFQLLGYLEYSLTVQGNPIFRNDATIGYDVKNVASYLKFASDMLDITGNNDIFSALLRSSFRMMAEGVTPANAVEGMMDSRIIASTLGRFGSRNRLRSKDDLDRFLDIFIEEHDAMVEVYNESQRQLTNRNWKLPAGLVERHPLGKNAPRDKVAEKFGSVMKQVPIGALLDAELVTGDIDPMTTVGQFLEDLAGKGDLRVPVEVLLAADKDVQDFFNDAVDNWENGKKAMERKIMRMIDPTVLRVPRKWIDDYSNGRLDPMDKRRLLLVLDVLAMTMDPDIAIDAGFRGVEIMSTRLGQMAVSDNLFDRMNAIAGISLNTQFRPLVEDYASDDADVRERARKALVYKSKVSGIHNVISGQIIKYGRSDLLDFLVDIDVSWNEKLANWNSIQNIGGIMAATDNLFYDCLKTENSEFDISGTAARLRKAESSMNSYEKLLFDSCKAEIASFKTDVMADPNTSNDIDVARFFEDSFTNAWSSMNSNIAASLIWASRDPSNDAMEKGTNEDPGTFLYQSQEHIRNGGMIAYMDELTGERNGVFDMEYSAGNRLHMLALVMDPTFEIELFDPISGRHGIMNRDKFIRSVIPDWDGSRLTGNQWIRILEQYPQLSDYAMEYQPEPITVGGNPTIIPGKTRGLVDSWTEWRKSRKSILFNAEDTAVKEELSHLYTDVSNVLFNWREYPSLLVRTIPEKVLRSVKSPRELSSHMMGAHRKWVSMMSYLSQHDPNGEVFRDFRSNYIEASIGRSMSQMISVVSASLDRIQDIINGENVGRNIVLGLAQEFVSRRFVSKALKDIGDNVTGINPTIPEHTRTIMDIAGNEVGNLLDSVRETASQTIDAANSVVAMMLSMYEGAASTGRFDIGGMRFGATMDDVALVRSSGRKDLERAVKDKLIASGIANPTDEQIHSDPGYIAGIESIDAIIEANNNLALTVVDDIINLAPKDIRFIMRRDYLTVDDASIANMIDLAKNLVKKSGQNLTPDSVEEEFHAIYDPYKKELDAFNRGETEDMPSIDKVRKSLGGLAVTYNNLVFEANLKNIRLMSHARVNANMYAAMNTTLDSLSDIMGEINKELKVSYDSAMLADEIKRKGYVVPQLDFSGQLQETMANRLRNMVNGAPNSTRVSVSGANTKEMAGFGFLDPRQQGDIPATVMSTQEILGLGSDADTWKCTLKAPGEDIDGRDVRSVANLKKDIVGGRIPQDAQVQVFNPNDNPHGIYWLFQPMQPNDSAVDYSRVGGILGLIQDESQEGMVLKAKKKLISAAKWIVGKRPIGKPNADKNAIAYGFDGPAADIYARLKSTLLDVRSRYKDELYKEFRGSLSGTELSEDAALIMAQVLTPAYRLYMTEVATGRRDTDRQVFLDVEDLFHGPEHFEQVWNELTENGRYRVSAAVVKFATPKEISYDILRAEAALEHEAYDEISIDQTRREARGAIRGWTGRDADDISVEEYMSHVSPYGYSRNNPVIVPQSRTPIQYYLNEIYGGNYGSMPEARFREPKQSIFATDEGKVRANGKFVDCGNFKARILTAFIPPSEQSISGLDADNELWYQFSSIADINKPRIEGVFRKEGEVGVGIVLDRDMLAEAEEWALDNGNGLLVPEQWAGKYHSMSKFTKEPVSIKGLNDKFVVVDPHRDESARVYRASEPQSNRSIGTSDEIVPTYVDNWRTGYYHVGDAEARGWGMKLRDFIIPKRKTVTKKPASILPADGLHGYKILTRQEILDAIGNRADKRIWLSKFNYEYLNGSARSNGELVVRDYLSKLSKAHNRTDGVLSRNVGRGDCVAILSNGRQYAPIVLPDNAPDISDMDYVHVSIDDSGSIALYYSGSPTLGSQKDSRVKISVKGMKGELMMSSDVMDPILDIAGEGVSYITINSDTYSSRSHGKNEVNMRDNMWSYVRSNVDEHKYSYIYKGIKDGKPEYKDSFLAAVTDHYRDNAPEILADANQNKWDCRIWRDLMSGEFKLVTKAMEPDDRIRAEANWTIREIMSMAYVRGIAPLDVLSPYNPNLEKGRYAVYQQAMAFGDVSADRLLKFYHAMDHRICYNGLDDPMFDNMSAPKDGSPVFNIYGQTKAKAPDGTWFWGDIMWGKLDFLGDDSSSRTPGSDAMHSWQSTYRRGLDRGYMPDEIADALRYADYLTDNPRYIQPKSSRITQDRADLAGFDENIDDTIAAVAMNFPYDSFEQVRHRADVNKIGREKLYIREVTENGETVERPWSHPRIESAVAKFNSRHSTPRMQHGFTRTMLEPYAAAQVGYTYNDSGENTVSVDNLVRAIMQVDRNITEHGIPVVVVDEGAPLDDRYPMPRISPEHAEQLWMLLPELEIFWRDKGGYEGYLAAMKDEAMKAYALINDIKDKRKQKALFKAMEFDFLMWNDWDPQLSSHVYGDVYMSDMYEAENKLADALRQGSEMGEPMDRDTYNELCDRGRKIQVDLKSGIEKRNAYHVMKDGSRGYYKEAEDKWLNKMLNNFTSLSRIMAMMSDALAFSNIAARGLFHGITLGSMNLCNALHVGPYYSKHHLDAADVSRWAHDKRFKDLFMAHRMAALDGKEIEVLFNMKSDEELFAYMNERRAKMTPFQRASDRFFQITTGGNWFTTAQMRIFLNRFVSFAEQTPGQEFWFEEQPDGRSYLEHRLDDPGRWFLEVLGGSHGNSPSFEIAVKALNSSKQGDFAQRGVLSMVLANAVKGRSLPNFLVTTMVCRFPQYTENVLRHMVSTIMPASSIYYVMTEKIANIASKRAEKNGTPDPHYELAQIHASLREAMLFDITHLGAGVVAAILIAMAGGVEPPEDEKKWGNIEEWTICGVRVGEAWWMEDILGLALPSAIFAKTMMLGKPRFDILFNGVTQVCYNNPMLKVADAVGFMLDPEGSIFTAYDKDVEMFQNARGGAPGILDWFQANAFSWGMSYLSQFYLPSFLRESYMSAQEWEVSYKDIYEEDERGVLTEEGRNGKTMKTTYLDAMRRRTTRRNPVLGWLFDMATSPNTGYMWSEMPRTVYRDDAQLDEMKRWSIVDMEPEQAQQKLLEIVTYMQAYDDMNELRKTGFYLDSTTKAALSSLVWDTVNEWDNWYNGLQADGYFDYYAIGGDFATGERIVGEIKQYYHEMRNYWTDFYYEKLRSEALSEPLVTYNRYNTTYATDDDGNIYATGFRPRGMLPFVSAPGTVNNPEGTAGRENDWTTISAVTGEPMDQRALMPLPQSIEDWPSLEEWAADGNGNGYSKLYDSWYGGSNSDSGSGSGSDAGQVGKLTGLPIGSGTTGGTKSKTTKTTYGGGGYSYSRGRSYGGGGGGSSFPNIYSRYSAPNMTSARAMGRVNLQRPDFDYLRPGFETKGSREAYKREDI